MYFKNNIMSSLSFDPPVDPMPHSCPKCKSDCYEHLFVFECTDCGYEFEEREEAYYDECC